VRRADGSRMAVPFLGHLLVGNSGSPPGGPFLLCAGIESAPSGPFKLRVASLIGVIRRTPVAMTNSGQQLVRGGVL
jgi:hypothetical protein